MWKGSAPYGRCHPRADNPGLYKKTSQGTNGEQAQSSVSLEDLFQFLPSGSCSQTLAFSSCPDFPWWWWTVTCKPRKYFSSKRFGQCFITTIESKLGQWHSLTTPYLLARILPPPSSLLLLFPHPSYFYTRQASSVVILMVSQSFLYEATHQSDSYVAIPV